MLSNLVKKIFGSRNERLIKQYSKIVAQINSLEPSFKILNDGNLRLKTDEFKQRFRNGETLDDLLPEAFALVREASKRVLEMRHFDVQLIGGMALHYGKIAEMRTGEGKTLVATLPAYLNALSGNGVHVVTVNDYLASRDAEWMGKLYSFLGLSYGINLSQMPHDAKKQAYEADITYGTNNEFGFDYLRDNMVYQPTERVQRGLNFSIVDEVDSILIDEARTPLIISGQADDNVDIYNKINVLVPSLKRQKQEDGDGDYWVDEKSQQVLLSEIGHENAEKLLERAGLLERGSSLYDAANISLVHHLYAALRAHSLFLRDQHYVVRDGEIVIVDEFTGRMMSGRRWSDGLHQAVEAKEGVTIQKENQTLASITFQNYFRMYQKLAGMTGTADTEAFEFNHIYGLETMVIPTHRKARRRDEMDKVYRSAREKFQAVLEDIKSCYNRGQPVLVGTTSIESSELLSKMLDESKLPHQVLNAKQHEREAHIIAQAGRPHIVTIATNMAGRGTDIVLGGNPEPDIAMVSANDNLTAEQQAEKINEIKAEWRVRHDAVVEAGGLHIIGTERHESRRVDNQLRGRSGRQGDPGSSRFYLSLEDSLLRIFASDRVGAIMDRLNMPEGEAIEHSWVTRAIEGAQRKVEGRNFDIRKQLLEYDDVANDQRKVIYQQRNELLEATEVGETVAIMRHDVVVDLFASHVPPGSLEDQWTIPDLEKNLEAELGLKLPIQKWLEKQPELHEETLLERVIKAAEDQYQAKVREAGEDVMRHFERAIMLQSLDSHWREHLAALDHLRQGIHLRAYAQKNPKQEYKREAFELFATLLSTVKREVTQITMLVKLQSEEDVEAIDKPAELENVRYQHTDYENALGSSSDVIEGELPHQPFTRKGDKIGRNDLCPCGSGVKYKNCHGALA